jgi:HD-GYP domain-containing protein (c-di-GMP phosphodiesterase class II)
VSGIEMDTISNLAQSKTQTLSSADLLNRLEKLNDVGIALSKEKDLARLLEMILVAAKEIAHADGGTLYRVTDHKELRFEIVRNDTLNIAMGGTSATPISFSNIPLYDEAGKPNNSTVVAYSVIHDQTINIDDAYVAKGFDFSGTKEFDQKTGYRSTSFLAVPMKNHENEIIGVLQLINAKNPVSKEIVEFSSTDERLVQSLASQAAIALTNRQLITQLEDLFEAFIGLINIAIDDKSPYTGGHCQRVPELTMMLAEAAHETQEGPLKDFKLEEADRYQLKIAALMHDCGKVTTPVHVVDKATKMQTLFDRINLIDTRFEVLKRDAEIELLRAKADPGVTERMIKGFQTAYEYRLKQIEKDREFLHQCNIGGEVMSEKDQQRVKEIAKYTWTNEKGEEGPFLSEEEVQNLTIQRGTLTLEEREIINHHIVVTIKMLEALPWPKHLKNVPEYAGGHHERMDGKGYPKGLTKDQMSVQARVMAIADIFEALTAKDRPYKSGKKLSEALAILVKFKENGHIDPDLFDVFIKEKIYLKYAEKCLDPDQIDEVDESKIFAGTKP